MNTLTATYTTADVAGLLGVSEWFVRDQVKKGHVSPLRLSDAPRARMRFTHDDVQQLMDTLRPPTPLPRKRRRHRRAS